MNYRAVKSLFSMLNGIFEKSVKDKIITENPCKYVDLPVMKKFCKEERHKTTSERIVSDEQMKKFYEQFEYDHKVTHTSHTQAALETVYFKKFRKKIVMLPVPNH